MRSTTLHKLSAVQVRTAVAIPEKSEVALRDGGGLMLQVRPGSKTWVFEFALDGSRRRMGIGSYPSTTLEAARKKAASLREVLASDRDPLSAREEERNNAKLALEIAKRTLLAQRRVGDVAEEWFRRIIVKTYRRPELVREMLDRDILPSLGNLMIGSAERTDLSRMLIGITERGAPVMANRVLAVTKQIFGYAIDVGYRDDDPSSRLRRKNVGGKEAARERNLSFDEIASLVRTLWSPEFNARPETTGVLRLVVLTGQRVGETVRARWEHIDFTAREWRIPAETTKNGRAHLVHLSQLAIETLVALRPEGKPNQPGYVFRGMRGGFTTERAVNRVIKRLLATPETSSEKKPTSVKDKHRGLKLKRDGPTLRGMPAFSVHDLRRTMVSRLADLGVAPHVVEKMVNHQMSGAMAVYNRGQYLDERREAFERWGTRVNSLRNDNVIQLATGTKI
jgi:integrase